MKEITDMVIDRRTGWPYLATIDEETDVITVHGRSHAVSFPVTVLHRWYRRWAGKAPSLEVVHRLCVGALRHPRLLRGVESREAE